MLRNVYKIEQRVGYQVGVMRFTSKFFMALVVNPQIL